MIADQPLGVSTAVLFAKPFECSPDDLHAAIAAAGLAGFASVSLWTMHYQLARAAGLRDDQLVEWLRAAGVDVVLVEAAANWTGADTAAIDAEADGLVALCRLVGARHVLACTLDSGTLDLDRAAAGLAHLARRLGAAGITPALEFLPWTSIPDLATAWRLIEAAGEPNVGIVLDGWHWVRQPGGPQPDVLRRIPGERIAVLQLCDAPEAAEADLLDETMNRRLLPGEGCGDLPELLGILDEIGASPLLAPEPFHTARAAAGPTAYAHQIAEATRAALGRA